MLLPDRIFHNLWALQSIEEFYLLKKCRLTGFFFALKLWNAQSSIKTVYRSDRSPRNLLLVYIKRVIVVAIKQGMIFHSVHLCISPIISKPLSHWSICRQWPYFQPSFRIGMEDPISALGLRVSCKSLPTLALVRKWYSHSLTIFRETCCVHPYIQSPFLFAM